MPVLPGAPATFRLTMVAADTLQPIAGQPVELQQFDPGIGTFRPISSLSTGGDGGVSASITLPAAPGRYRFRASYRGSSQWKPDSSPEVAVEIKAPTA